LDLGLFGSIPDCPGSELFIDVQRTIEKVEISRENNFWGGSDLREAYF